jgi:arsenate reductase
MRFFAVSCLFGFLSMPFSAESARAELYPDLAKFAEQRIAEFEEIPTDRKLVLNKLAAYVRQSVVENKPAKLTFVCTHNSRRSHFAQLWAQAAAAHYGIQNVLSYSGGTEATAFNPRSIAALERCGFRITKPENSEFNPRYAVRFQSQGEAVECFSKVYNDAPNPSSGYCAVMTCSQADKSCPVVPGCDLRIAIPFDDPKISDGTPGESAAYDKRCAQIAREMFYVMSVARQ